MDLTKLKLSELLELCKKYGLKNRRHSKNNKQGILEMLIDHQGSNKKYISSPNISGNQKSKSIKKSKKKSVKKSIKKSVKKAVKKYVKK